MPEQQAEQKPERGPLEVALATSDCDGVRAAIARGEDVDAPFADGLTALCRASALGERRILRLLLAAHADVDAVPSRACGDGSVVSEHVADAGFAALHWACREGKLECASMLVEASATVDVRASEGVTPFMLACKGGHYECARMLRRAGADVEAANARGGTAMVVACVMGATETVRHLLGMGADADAVTVAVDDSEQLFQCRPLVTACRYNRPKIVSMLLSAGAGTEAMTTALTELESFPSFHECAKAVRRALERKDQRQRQRAVGANGASTDESKAEAEARAEAAMAALLAEEVGARPDESPGGKKQAKLSPAATLSEEERGSDSKRRRKKAKRANVAQAVATQVVATQAVATQVVTQAAASPEMEVATEAADEAQEAKAGVSQGRRGKRFAPAVRQSPPMNAHSWRSEYEQYHNQARERRSSGEIAPRVPEESATRSPSSSPWLSVRLEDSDDDGDDGETERSNLEGSPFATETGGLAWLKDDGSNKENDSSSNSVSSCNEELLQPNLDSVSQLELFLHRQKFTTSAMSFFLAKVREGASAARHAICATANGPPAPLPTPLSAYEIQRRSRKIRRPPPPPGCLSSPSPRTKTASASSRMLSRVAAAPTASGTLPAAGDCVSVSGGCAWFCPLERRLEQEMEAARAREMALHAALRQRSEELAELDDGPPEMSRGPQTYYERRAIEEWLMNQSLAKCRSRQERRSRETPASA